MSGKKDSQVKKESKRYLVTLIIVMFLLSAIAFFVGFRYYVQEMRETSYRVTLKSARLNLDAGDFKEAMKFYRKAIELKGESPEILVEMAKCQLGLNNRQAAKELYLRAAEMDKQNAEIRYQLAIIYFEEANLKQAEKWAIEASHLKANYVAPRLFLANLYLKQENYQKALAQFMEVLKINPNIEVERKDLLKKIALCYEKIGKKEVAIYYYQQALKLDPGDYEIRQSLNNLGVKIK